MLNGHTEVKVEIFMQIKSGRKCLYQSFYTKKGKAIILYLIFPHIFICFSISFQRNKNYTQKWQSFAQYNIISRGYIVSWNNKRDCMTLFSYVSLVTAVAFRVLLKLKVSNTIRVSLHLVKFPKEFCQTKGISFHEVVFKF